MGLPTGTRLGPYEILSAIGAGGMGEVYEARDSKLGRNVAIKILPEGFAQDHDRLSRFQREARMLAALNHPNIATIYGLEQSDGVHYLVMELIPGQTLAERLRVGPLTIEEALEIGGQIAEAMEAAHEKQVIHRDLKPANVKVTPEGRVKVLDFGLAKAFDADTEDAQSAPTLTSMGTEDGRILGTPTYMSPEQARGKPVDKRTDIWAFGCVLYELLAGQRAFEGDTVSDTLARVLECEPDWKFLPAATPAKVRELLRRCLEKDLNRRLRDIGDGRMDLLDARTETKTREVPPEERFKVTRRTAIGGLAGAAAVAAAGTSVWYFWPRAPMPVMRLSIDVSPAQQFAGFTWPIVSISPVGKHVAFIGVHDGVRHVYLRALDSPEAKPMVSTEGAYCTPLFSPDGQWLAFFSTDAQELKKISIVGGPSVTVTKAGGIMGASWGSDETIIYADPYAHGVQRVSSGGGTPKRLTLVNPQNGEIAHRWPVFLPGGKAFLFVIEKGSGPDDWQIAAQNLDTGHRQVIIQGGTFPQCVSEERLVYVHRGTLLAVPFDANKLQVKGIPVAAGEDVRESGFGAAQFGLSPQGSLVYVSASRAAPELERRLVWVNRNGTEQSLAVPARAYLAPRISSDGRTLAVEIDGQVWLLDLSGETLTRLTFEGENGNPSWTPDGKRLAFQSDQNVLFWQLADGSGGRERLTKSELTQRADSWSPDSWSPDGQLLAFTELDPATGRDIWVLRLSDRTMQPFLKTPANESSPRFSPDGRWLAYVSDESGRYEIYVQPYPGPGGKRQISTEGGTEPLWNRNGRELFYRSGNKMMAVAVTTLPSFTFSSPRMLFDASQYMPPTGPYSYPFPNYDVSPDGQRFLMITKETKPQINVVLNWSEELKHRVSSGE